jgi:hypothetical protein
MGPGKPPTASRDDIANSGLEVVPATEIVRLGEQGKVLENCVEPISSLINAISSSVNGPPVTKFGIDKTGWERG